MPSGGKLTMTTQNVELHAEQLLGFAENKPGSYVLLTVSDNGCGMDKAVQAKIFEPFFTTKGTEGTGLGLATVFGIVKQSFGKIEVVSEPGKGASFKIYLPCVPEPISSPNLHSAVPESLRGSETILLVEDDEAVRSLASYYLQANGYTILGAANGDAALRLFEKQADTIDLLITDVVMPRMSGRELADQLVAKRPNLRVLYLSGYTNDAVLRHGVSHDQAHFLQKPFSPMSLALKVRETLNAP
jgi:CheY-like chemotaxis protein